MMNRRQLLLSAATSTLAAAGLVYLTLPDSGQEPTAAPADDGTVFLCLSKSERKVVGAIASVLLSAYPASREPGLATIVKNIDQALSFQFPRVQQDVHQLLLLLETKLGRLMLLAQTKTVSDTSITDLNTRLWQWRDSELELLQTAYIGLHNLTMAAYFSGHPGWAVMGYPGPPLIR